MKIAFFGTGLMGQPMARNVLRHQHPLMVYNRNASKAADLVAAGAIYTAIPSEAISFCDVAITMLADYQAICDVLLAPDSLAAFNGKILIQMATISPKQSKQVAQAIETAGGQYLECPVLGSIPEATSATLQLMAGGEAELFYRMEPVLKCFGPKPVLIGAVGQGAAVKLAMNQLIASLTSAFSLSLGLVQREGVEVDKFMGICRDSALYAPTYDKKLQRMLDRDYGRPNFPLKHLLKDVRLFQQAADDCGLNAILLQSVQNILETTVAQGLADADYCALYNAVDPA